MPKERRRSLKEALTCSSSPLSSGKERQGHCSSTQDCDERLPMASARPVPQLTLTAEEGSGARELEIEEAEGLNGGAPLRRKLSTSSVSSNGSSVVLEESEDDILSDNETKSKGIVTLERVGDGGEVGHDVWRYARIHPGGMEGSFSDSSFDSKRLALETLISDLS